MQSACVERAYKVNKVVLALILDLLLLHAQVVVITVVGIHYDLVEVANNADLSISLDVVFSPFL